MNRWGAVLGLVVALVGCEMPQADDMASTTQAVESAPVGDDGADMRAQFWHMCVWACIQDYGCESSTQCSHSQAFAECAQTCDIFYPGGNNLTATSANLDNEPWGDDSISCMHGCQDQDDADSRNCQAVYGQSPFLVSSCWRAALEKDRACSSLCLGHGSLLVAPDSDLMKRQVCRYDCDQMRLFDFDACEQGPASEIQPCFDQAWTDGQACLLECEFIPGGQHCGPFDCSGI